MESVFDLPAHPLMVHFPVVAIPVLSILAILLVLKPSLRSSWRWFAIGLAVITAISTLLAASSGEALVELIEADDWVEDHESLGETLRIFVIGLAASLTALVLIARDEISAKRPIGIGISAITILFALLATVWTIRTGHEGANLTWGGVVETEAETTTTTTTAAPTTTTTATTTSAADAATTTTTTSTTTAPSTTAAAVGTPNGMALYEANCARCHGSDGVGTRGPSLGGIAAKHPEVQNEINQITNGGDRMPSFGDKLTEAEILAVVGYYREAFTEGEHSHDD